MRPSHRDALNRWLAAERDDQPQEADVALFELFEALPLVAPPAGFADRVMARAGLAAPAAAAAKRDFFASRPLRLLLGLCLAALGFGVIWLPPVLELLAGIWSLGEVVQAGVSALTRLTQGLASALRVWDFLVTVGRALSEPLTQPRVMALLMGCLVVSSLAFRFLRDRVSGERNLTYVDPI